MTVAHSIYQATLGMTPPGEYRAPVGVPLEDIVHVGSIVTTNYQSGPYVVVAISGPMETAEYPPHWSLCLFDVDKLPQQLDDIPKAHAWINEIVPVNGRLLKLFANNDDEVFVSGTHARIDAIVRRPVQLVLF